MSKNQVNFITKYMSQLNNNEEKKEINFDLPDVSKEGGKMVPRIHKGPEDSTCINCEG